MIETVTDFNEFNRLRNPHFSVHYEFREHASTLPSASLGEPRYEVRHLHFDMTAASASLHFYSGRPTHIIRFKHRQVWTNAEPHLAIDSARLRFREFCIEKFAKPLNATEGSWA
jgi:hypothetical protein